MKNEELNEDYIEEDYEDYDLKAWLMPYDISAFFPLKLKLSEWEGM